MLKIYHNPRCRKSRAGLQYLADKGREYEVVDYLKNPLSYEELRIIVQKLHKSPLDIIRKQETIYKSDFKGRKFSDEEWIKIITENPKLLQRPIVEYRHKAVLAQPPEEIDRLL